MSRFMKILEYIEEKPEIVISFAVAIVLLIFGLYIGGPWYVATPTAVFGGEIHPEVVRVMSSILYLVPSSVNIYGLIKSKRRWASVGAFGMFLAFFFAFLIRVLTVGFFPFIWVYPLGLAVVSGVLYLTFARTKVVKV